MRVIDTTPYEYAFKRQGRAPEAVTVYPLNFLAEMIFHPALQLPGKESYSRGKLLDKVEAAMAAEATELMVEEAEWEKLKAACENVPGLGPQFHQSQARVFDAKQVEVEKKKAE